MQKKNRAINRKWKAGSRRYKLLAFYFLLTPALLLFCSPIIWSFVIPDHIVKDFLEQAAAVPSSRDEIKISIEGLRKGFFFSIFIDRLELKIGNTEALRISAVSGRINPLYLLKKQLAFSIKGEIGRGTIDGSFNLPAGGRLTVSNVDVGDIPYLTSAGLKGSGLISGSITLKNNIADILFEIPDADVQSSDVRIPLPLSWFNKMHGALSIKKNVIQINSIGFEGKKGYARLSGFITLGSKTTQGDKDLVFELMPDANYLAAARELKFSELTLLDRYQVSPGYYVIPVEGPL